MTQDHTAQALEALLAAVLPQGAAKEVYRSTEKRESALDFGYAEIIADPYTVEIRDEEGIPAFASAPVYLNYVAPNDADAERFLRILNGFAFALTPAWARSVIAALPAPLNLLRVYEVQAVVNGFEPQPDDTLLAQVQFTFSVRPVITEHQKEA